MCYQHIVGFLDQNYHYKSVAKQIPMMLGWHWSHTLTENSSPWGLNQHHILRSEFKVICLKLHDHGTGISVEHAEYYMKIGQKFIYFFYLIMGEFTNYDQLIKEATYITSNNNFNIDAWQSILSLGLSNYQQILWLLQK